jgi:prophage antirepressor-like protein
MMVFEGHEVEIIEVNGQILFNSNHVGFCPDFADSTIRDQVSKMSDKHAIKLTNSDVGLTNIRILNNAGENFLTESGVYKLIFKSRMP